MASPHQRPPQVGDTTNLLLKKLVTATQDLGGSGGIFLTVAEANALYAKQLSNLSDLSNIATARTNLGLGTGNSPSFNQVTSTVATGTAPFVVASTTLVANLHAATADSTTAAATVTVVDDTTTNATMYPTWVTANSGNLPLKVTSTKLSFNPSTGFLTLAGDASIHGVTAGMGPQSLATNTVFGAGAYAGAGSTGQFSVFIGTSAGAAVVGSGNHVAIGYQALQSQTGTGNSNIAIGRGALGAHTSGGNNVAIGGLASDLTGSDNVAVGVGALNASAGADTTNTAVGKGTLASTNGGSGNTALGNTAGLSNTTGSGSVFLGANAGKFATTQGNELFIDNQDRGSRANDIARAIIYGTFNATAASQTLTINASTTIPYGFNVGGTAYSFGALPSGATTSGPVITVPATTYTVTGTNTATAFQANYFGAPTFTNVSVGTITDAFNTIFKGPPVAAGSQVITRAHTLGIVDSTNAASSITGGLIVATTLGTTATSVGIGGGNINAGGTLTVGGTSTLTGAVTQTAKTATYNNVATAGWGVVAVYADGGSAANANARAAAAAAYTVGAADGTFVVSGNILINSGTTFSMSLDCVYTDQGNTSRTLVFPLAQLAGTFVVTGLATNVTGTGPYESASMTIRCKAGSTITIRPSAGGTYTTVNYDVYANIRQVG